MKNLIYLNEDAINEELITHHGGELEETIQRVNRNIGVGGEVGGEVGDPTGFFARLKGAISANYERGKEREFIYDLTDDVAKFTLLMEIFDASNAPEVDQTISIDERNKLITDSPVLITAPLIRIPIGEIKDQFDYGNLDGLKEGVADIVNSGLLSSEEADEAKELREDIASGKDATGGMRKILDSLGENDFYRTCISSEVDFVMELKEEHFRTRPRDFPSTSTEYAIIGKIITKLGHRDTISLIDFTSAGRPVENPREQRQEERKIQGEITDIANNMLDRDVSISEFELSYPDVQIEPLAIY